MFSMKVSALVALSAALAPTVSAHAALFHPSMWGFNVTASSNTRSPGDNRPVVPLMHRPFNEWWFHGLQDYPPHPKDIFQLPVGGTQTTEIACDKGATSWYASSAGSVSVQSSPDGNNVCPGYPMSQYHTNGIDDLGGCALAVSYNNNPDSVQPDDFTVFSVQHTCVWQRFTNFDIPADMPPCPDGKCLCSFNWIHKADAGSEQMFLTMFQCNFQGAKGSKAVAKGKVPRRCGAEPEIGKAAVPSNCTVGAKTPMYWLQSERNNMFEGIYSPPLYLDLYGFGQGAQNDIFEGSALPVTSAPASTSTLASSSAVPTSSSVTSSVAAPASSSAAAPPSSSVAPSSSAAAPTSSSAASSSAPAASSSAGGVNPGAPASSSSAGGVNPGAPSSSASPSVAAASTGNVRIASSPAASATPSSTHSIPSSSASHDTPSSSSIPSSSASHGGSPPASTSIVGSATSTSAYAPPATPVPTTSVGHVNPSPSSAAPSPSASVCKKRKTKRATIAELALAKQKRGSASFAVHNKQHKRRAAHAERNMF